jgi:hypothetical protein
MTGTYSQLYSIQTADFDALAQALAGSGNSGTMGVLNGLGATVTGTDLNVTIGTGQARLSNGTVVNFASTTVVSFTGIPDATNPKKSIIVVDSTGTILKRNGTAEAALPSGDVRRTAIRPAPPNLSAGDIPLVEVWLPANATTIAAADVTDRSITVYPDRTLEPYFYDDFFGSALDATNDWSTTLVTGGTVSLVNPIAGFYGEALLQSGITGGASARLFHNWKYWRRGDSARLFFRFVSNLGGASAYKYYIGYVLNDFDPGTDPAGTNEHALVGINSSLDTTLVISTADGTTRSKLATGMPTDSSAAHTGILEMRSGDVRFWYDGILKLTKTTNLPLSATTMRIYAGIANVSAVNATLGIDYLLSRATRPYP